MVVEGCGTALSEHLQAHRVRRFLWVRGVWCAPSVGGSRELQARDLA